MALRNQPYLPLYVKDFRSDDKLARCSASSHGVYILLLCILHSEQEYGKILLRQKERQNVSTIKNFADVFVRMMPFGADEIEIALTELVDFDVIQIDGDTLYQKRMVKDGKISEIRASAGKKGSDITNSKTSFAAAKSSAKRSSKKQQNTVIVNEYENATESESNNVFTAAIKDFKEHRKNLKKPMTEKAVEILKSKLETLAPNDTQKQIDLLNTAILNGWQTVYPDKDKTPDKPKVKYHYFDENGKPQEGWREP